MSLNYTQFPSTLLVCWYLLCHCVAQDEDSCLAAILGRHQFDSSKSGKPVTFVVTRGDYSPLLALVVDELTKAKVLG